MKFYLLISVIAVLAITHNSRAEGPTPPVAKKQPVTKDIHGIKLVDPYAWLRNREAPEVMSYLKNENLYTEEVMKGTEQLQTSLFEEMKSRIKETDLSVPYRMDEYMYYSRTEEGKQYRIHCRRGTEEGAPEEITFDENKYAEGKAYFSLGALKISPNHNILAYSTDTSGAEKFELRFLNLITGEQYPEVIASVTYGIQWAEDNKTIFYTLMDDTGRAYLIKRHALGSNRLTIRSSTKKKTDSSGLASAKPETKNT